MNSILDNSKLRQLPTICLDRAKRRIVSLRIPVERRDDLLLLGSRYGGWTVPSRLLSKDSICYCVGVGEDATFDLELINRFGCVVHAFDPTPRAKIYVEQHCTHESSFLFHEFGVWSQDTSMRFYAPRNPLHVSHSITNLQRTNEYFDAAVLRLSTIMASLDHQKIDLLKLDIEGAEYQVLRDIRESSINPRILCVEFDQPAPIRRTLAAIASLRESGFRLVHVREWNFTFVNLVELARWETE